MAEKIEKIEDFNFKPNQVASRELTRKFGKLEDHAELHVLSVNNQLLQSNLAFDTYTFPPEGIDTEGLISEINMDPVAELGKYGYTSGKYKVKLNLLRRKISNTSNLIFSIKELSSSRTELKLRINTTVVISQIVPSIRNFINEVESNIFFKDFGLNFNKGDIITVINIALDERGTNPEVLIKLLKPLPPTYNTNDELNIVEEIIDPTVLTIDLGILEGKDDSIPLQGPNFKIDTRLNSSVPSNFKTYDDILNQPTVLSSSYNHLLNYLDKQEVPEIQYDYIRPVSESFYNDEEIYHFENFIHFSSAVERLKNFEYKLSLIELYDSQVNNINLITGDTSGSSFVLNDKSSITSKKDKLIKGLDGYEQFLYFTSGSKFTWPKSNTKVPYSLYSVSSSIAKNWLGEERSTLPTYGGQLLSASLFDRQNQNNLERLVPNHILDNSDNDQYRLFINMVGQHFDQVWIHIKHMTEINDTHHKRGVSKELVYFTLKSLGVEAFDQFENSNLIEYILGQGTTGSAFYDTPDSQTLVSASNEGSIPKKDISKEIWKRLYHNAPYLLKTKGTERGIKALISCYGIPSTLLNVKEYGGPVKDMTGYKTFSYEKSGLALNGDSGTGGHFIKIPYSSSLIDTHFTDDQQHKKTVEFRIKPNRLETNQHLFSLSGSTDTVGIQYLGYDQHLLLIPYTGNDISSSGDANTYGKLQYTDLGRDTGAVSTSFTPNFPIFNGDFWNIFINASGEDQFGIVSSNDLAINFGAYQANFNKNIFRITSSLAITSSNITSLPWGLNGGGAKEAYFGGLSPNPESEYSDIDILRYSGSLQEIKIYVGENLNDDTLTKHALEPFMYAGNTTSSAYDNLILRLPLGSNDQQDSSSFHPNIDINFLSRISTVAETAGNPLNPELADTAFATSIAASATINSSNKVTFTADPGTDRVFPITPTLVVGKEYIVSATISDYSDLTPGPDTCGFDAVGGILSSERRTSNGNIGPTVFTADGGDIRIFANLDVGCVIENISIKEYNPFLISFKSNMSTQKWEEVIETHHHPTPDTVGISMTSEKVRIDEGIIDDNLLSTTIKSEVSSLDRQPQDFEDLGVFFSPTTEINEDIVYQLGAFRLDDYIGSPLPSAQTASNYKDLKQIKDTYFKKVKRRYNYWDYVKLIQYIDHTLFKLVEQFVPAKANLKTGLLIEPHYLERTKFARELPIIEDGQTMTPGSYTTIDFQIDPEKQFTLEGELGGGSVVTTNNFLRTTGSNSQRQEQGTNFTIDVSGHILDEQQNIAQGPIKPLESFKSNISTTYPDGLYGNNRFMNGGFANIIDGTDPIELGGVGEGTGFNPFSILPVDVDGDGNPDEDVVNIFGTSFGNYQIFNNTLVLVATGVTDNGLAFIATTVPGKEYILKFDNVTAGSSVNEIVKVRVYKTVDGGLQAGLSFNPQDLLTFGGGGTLVSGNTAGEVEFIAESNKSIIAFSSFDATGFAVNLTNFEIRERQNGTFVNPEIWPGITRPSYVERESSTLLGNAPRAVRSRIYFKSTEVRDNYSTIIQ